jgi:hypothetical protein
MRSAGFGLMGLGVLIVVAAFAPQIEEDALRYAMTALGPCVGGLGAWLKQEADRGESPQRS